MKKYATFSPDGLHPFHKLNLLPTEQDRLQVRAQHLCWETKTSHEQREGSCGLPVLWVP